MTLTSIMTRRRARDQRSSGAESSDRVEVLLKREAPALLAYFTRRVRPTEDAADLLSETMVVARRRSTAVPLNEQQARMWLLGVARNVLSAYRRGQIRRDALAAELRAELATRAPQILAVAGSGDPRVEQLQLLVAALPEIDREIVSLVVWDEVTLAEVATLLDMPAGTVRSRYSRHAPPSAHNCRPTAARAPEDDATLNRGAAACSARFHGCGYCSLTEWSGSVGGR